MKIALVHDYLAQDGGAEQVLRAFHEIWPDAPIFVLFKKPGAVAGLDDADIRESFLAKIPFARSRYRWLLPLMPMATERHDLSGFDVVLSSSSAFAKGVITSPQTLHISYCHSPTRYLWIDTQQYVQDLGLNPIARAVLPQVLHRLRMWDAMSTSRVDQFIANSHVVQQRINKFYRRQSDLIYPPVHMADFALSKDVDDYFVTGGRLVPYKRMDLVIATFNRLQYPLKIFGIGPELDRLRKMAKPNITFLGRISDTEKGQLLARAKAFIHPQVEDLGITPIESMAAGRPVIAYGKGGATETVIDGKTGVLFHEQSWESLLDTVLHFDAMEWNVQEIRQHALAFSEKRFKKEIQNYVEQAYQKNTQAKLP